MHPLARRGGHLRLRIFFDERLERAARGAPVIEFDLRVGEVQHGLRRARTVGVTLRHRVQCVGRAFIVFKRELAAAQPVER